MSALYVELQYERKLWLQITVIWVFISLAILRHFGFMSYRSSESLFGMNNVGSLWDCFFGVCGTQLYAQLYKHSNVKKK